MPRGKRNFVDGAYYHIVNRGNNKQQVYHSLVDYRSFMSWVIRGKNTHNIRLHAYCLMPNHFHLVLQPQVGTSLSKFMHWVMDKHIHNYRKIYGSVGRIWQGPFGDFIIQGDEHLITVLRYVEGNPVRANMVGGAADWLWSSHRERIGMMSGGKFLDDPPFPLPQNWDAFVDAPLTDSELEKLRYSVRRGAPYGEKKWREQTADQLGISHTLRPRGRPRKT